MQVKDLKVNPRNPRLMEGGRKKLLKKSLREYGDLSGIVVNKTTGMIVSGHQRVSVMPSDSVIKYETIYESPTPTGTVATGVIMIDGEAFKYREVKWTEYKQNAAMIAANKHSGEWIDESLNSLIIELNEMNYDMELLGLDEMIIEHESDEEYLKNEVKTFEQIPTENKNMNVRYDDKNDGFHIPEIKQKFVLMLDCPNESVRDKLKDIIAPIAEAEGAKIY